MKHTLRCMKNEAGFAYEAWLRHTESFCVLLFIDVADVCFMATKLTLHIRQGECFIFLPIPSRFSGFSFLPMLLLVQIWHNTTHDKKVFTNGTFCDIIIKTKRVGKLACQRASEDCSASVLRIAKRSA